MPFRTGRSGLRGALRGLEQFRAQNFSRGSSHLPALPGHWANGCLPLGDGRDLRLALSFARGKLGPSARRECSLPSFAVLRDVGKVPPFSWTSRAQRSVKESCPCHEPIAAMTVPSLRKPSTYCSAALDR